MLGSPEEYPPSRRAHPYERSRPSNKREFILLPHNVQGTRLEIIFGTPRILFGSSWIANLEALIESGDAWLQVKISKASRFSHFLSTAGLESDKMSVPAFDSQ